MKKIIVLLIFCTLALSAEKIEFFGNYHKDFSNFVGGCIYNGKDSMGTFIKVYSHKGCPISSGKTRFGGTFSCNTKSLIKKYTKKETNVKYEMYEGTCEVSN